MIDTHSHIYEPDFSNDIQDVITRAQGVGVQQVLLPNINEGSIEPMLALCSQHPSYVQPMMGLHPEDVKEDYGQVLDRIQTRLEQPNHPFIAIGEIGLDFYWDKTFVTEQQNAFERQLQWAEQYNLPVVIHSRAAHTELVAIMKKHAQLKGIFHCFGGTVEEAEELLAFPGFMLGIGGVVTFKKSTLPEVLASCVPLSRIVLETDAPYLAPTPHRGKRNEPSFLTNVAEKLSAVYNVTSDVISHETMQNTLNVFPHLKKI